MSFIITEDVIEYGADNGAHGPYKAEHSAEEILASPNKEYFEMYDSDGELYYKGYYLASGAEDSDELQPLDCFGEPNAGCTEIKMLSSSE